METSLKTGFAQIFSCCPKNLSCPKFMGGLQPPRPPGPYAYLSIYKSNLADIFSHLGAGNSNGSETAFVKLSA